MSLFMYDMDELRSQVQEAFGDTEHYLVVVKHNNWQSDIIKLFKCHRET
jgi:hypothetical protein